MLAAQLIPDLSALFTRFLAESVLVLAIPLVILADLFSGRERRDAAASAVGLGALVVAFFLALWQPADGTLLTRLLRADGLAKAFRILAIGTGALAAVAAIRARDLPRSRTEFFVLLLGAVLGAALTAAANDFAMLYLAIETLSICGYLLAGFKKETPGGSEAALKYVIFGAISSGMMLYGMSLLYGFSGSATITTPADADFTSLQQAAGAASGSPLFLVAIVLVFAGLAYKVAAAPFQFWCPDVYEGSPTAVAAFLAVVSKGAGFAALLRFVSAATGPVALQLGSLPDALASSNEHIRVILLLMALVTMTIGNLAALRQRDGKRLLAYSAIAHAGYLLLGVAVTSHEGATAVVFYMIIYLFMTLAVFYMLAMVERETGRTDIDAFEGLGFRAPVLAACMGICLISLTGLPPTAGFVGKFFIFKEVFATDSLLFFWGGIIGLLNGVISLAYYAKFLRVMYLCDRSRIPDGPFAFAGLDKGLTVLLTIPVIVLCLAFGGLRDIAYGLAHGVF